MKRQNHLKLGGALYLIADRKVEQSFEDFIKTLESALLGGIRLVQYRNKVATSKVYYEEALVVQKMTRQYDALMICNDRIDIAMAIRADGIHIGQSDLPLNVVRRMVGESMIIGQTCKSESEFISAQVEGADYIGTGAFYPTSTKQDATLLSHLQLGELIKNTSLPVYGIGGVTIEKIDAVMLTGTSGVAISSAIMEADSPEQAVILAQQRLKHFA